MFDLFFSYLNKKCNLPHRGAGTPAAPLVPMLFPRSCTVATVPKHHIHFLFQRCGDARKQRKSPQFDLIIPLVNYEGILKIKTSPYCLGSLLHRETVAFAIR